MLHNGLYCTSPYELPDIPTCTQVAATGFDESASNVAIFQLCAGTSMRFTWDKLRRTVEQ